MSISEDVSFDLVLNDGKVRVRTALDRIVSRIQVHYINQIVAKVKSITSHGALGGSYRSDYWAIVERVPIRFLNFTLWHKDRIIVRFNDLSMYDGCYTTLDIYDRKIAKIVIDEINKLSAHYPRARVNIIKHFRPLCTEPGHLIAGDALL